MSRIPAPRLVAPTVLALALSALVVLAAACSDGHASRTATPPFKVSATIQEIMANIIDPAADETWESVSEEWDKDGHREHKPETDEQWLAVLNHAVALQESADLLTIPGRAVAPPGKNLEDSGVAGILDAAGVEAAIKIDPEAYAAFIAAYHEAAHELVVAAQNRDVESLKLGGARLDAVCEACHARFWYPDAQKAPTR